jgi:hypothetical protein
LEESHHKDGSSLIMMVLVRGIVTHSGCGGLFRNSNGRWTKGYAKKIGSCDVFHAEMWGLYLGLDMA